MLTFDNVLCPKHHRYVAGHEPDAIHNMIDAIVAHPSTSFMTPLQLEQLLKTGEHKLCCLLGDRFIATTLTSWN